MRFGYNGKDKCGNLQQSSVEQFNKQVVIYTTQVTLSISAPQTRIQKYNRGVLE